MAVGPKDSDMADLPEEKVTNERLEEESSDGPTWRNVKITGKPAAKSEREKEEEKRINEGYRWVAFDGWNLCKQFPEELDEDQVKEKKALRSELLKMLEVNETGLLCEMPFSRFVGLERQYRLLVGGKATDWEDDEDREFTILVIHRLANHLVVSEGYPRRFGIQVCRALGDLLHGIRNRFELRLWQAGGTERLARFKSDFASIFQSSKEGGGKGDAEVGLTGLWLYQELMRPMNECYRKPVDTSIYVSNEWYAELASLARQSRWFMDSESTGRYALEALKRDFTEQLSIQTSAKFRIVRVLTDPEFCLTLLVDGTLKGLWHSRKLNASSSHEGVCLSVAARAVKCAWEIGRPIFNHLPALLPRVYAHLSRSCLHIPATPGSNRGNPPADKVAGEVAHLFADNKSPLNYIISIIVYTLVPENLDPATRLAFFANGEKSMNDIFFDFVRLLEPYTSGMIQISSKWELNLAHFISGITDFYIRRVTRERCTMSSSRLAAVETPTQSFMLGPLEDLKLVNMFLPLCLKSQQKRNENAIENYESAIADLVCLQPEIGLQLVLETQLPLMESVTDPLVAVCGIRTLSRLTRPLCLYAPQVILSLFEQMEGIDISQPLKAVSLLTAYVTILAFLPSITNGDLDLYGFNTKGASSFLTPLFGYKTETNRKVFDAFMAKAPYTNIRNYPAARLHDWTLLNQLSFNPQSVPKSGVVTQTAEGSSCVITVEDPKGLEAFYKAESQRESHMRDAGAMKEADSTSALVGGGLGPLRGRFATQADFVRERPNAGIKTLGYNSEEEIGFQLEARAEVSRQLPELIKLLMAKLLQAVSAIKSGDEDFFGEEASDAVESLLSRVASIADPALLKLMAGEFIAWALREPRLPVKKLAHVIISAFNGLSSVDLIRLCLDAFTPHLLDAEGKLATKKSSKQKLEWLLGILEACLYSADFPDIKKNVSALLTVAWAAMHSSSKDLFKIGLSIVHFIVSACSTPYDCYSTAHLTTDPKMLLLTWLAPRWLKITSADASTGTASGTPLTWTLDQPRRQWQLPKAAEVDLALLIVADFLLPYLQSVIRQMQREAVPSLTRVDRQVEECRGDFKGYIDQGTEGFSLHLHETLRSCKEFDGGFKTNNGSLPTLTLMQDSDDLGEKETEKKRGSELFQRAYKTIKYMLVAVASTMMREEPQSQLKHLVPVCSVVDRPVWGVCTKVVEAFVLGIADDCLGITVDDEHFDFHVRQSHTAGDATGNVAGSTASSAESSSDTLGSTTVSTTIRRSGSGSGLGSGGSNGNAGLLDVETSTMMRYLVNLSCVALSAPSLRDGDAFSGHDPFALGEAFHAAQMWLDPPARAYNLRIAETAMDQAHSECMAYLWLERNDFRRYNFALTPPRARLVLYVLAQTQHIYADVRRDAQAFLSAIASRYPGLRTKMAALAITRYEQVVDSVLIREAAEAKTHAKTSHASTASRAVLSRANQQRRPSDLPRAPLATPAIPEADGALLTVDPNRAPTGVDGAEIMQPPSDEEGEEGKGKEEGGGEGKGERELEMAKAAVSKLTRTISGTVVRRSSSTSRHSPSLRISSPSQTASPGAISSPTRSDAGGEPGTEARARSSSCVKHTLPELAEEAMDAEKLADSERLKIPAETDQDHGKIGEEERMDGDESLRDDERMGDEEEAEDEEGNGEKVGTDKEGWEHMTQTGLLHFLADSKTKRLVLARADMLFPLLTAIVRRLSVPVSSLTLRGRLLGVARLLTDARYWRGDGGHASAAYKFLKRTLSLLRASAPAGTKPKANGTSIAGTDCDNSRESGAAMSPEGVSASAVVAAATGGGALQASVRIAAAAAAKAGRPHEPSPGTEDSRNESRDNGSGMHWRGRLMALVFVTHCLHPAYFQNDRELVADLLQVLFASLEVDRNPPLVVALAANALTILLKLFLSHKNLDTSPQISTTSVEKSTTEISMVSGEANLPKLRKVKLTDLAAFNPRAPAIQAILSRKDFLSTVVAALPCLHLQLTRGGRREDEATNIVVETIRLERSWPGLLIGKLWPNLSVHCCLLAQTAAQTSYRFVGPAATLDALTEVFETQVAKWVKHSISDDELHAATIELIGGCLRSARRWDVANDFKRLLTIVAPALAESQKVFPPEEMRRFVDMSRFALSNIFFGGRNSSRYPVGFNRKAFPHAEEFVRGVFNLTVSRQVELDTLLPVDLGLGHMAHNSDGESKLSNDAGGGAELSSQQLRKTLQLLVGVATDLGGALPEYTDFITNAIVHFPLLLQPYQKVREDVTSIYVKILGGAGRHTVMWRALSPQGESCPEYQAAQRLCQAYGQLLKRRVPELCQVVTLDRQKYEKEGPSVDRDIRMNAVKILMLVQATLNYSRFHFTGDVCGSEWDLSLGPLPYLVWAHPDTDFAKVGINYQSEVFANPTLITDFHFARRLLEPAFTIWAAQSQAKSINGSPSESEFGSGVEAGSIGDPLLKEAVLMTLEHFYVKNMVTHLVANMPTTNDHTGNLEGLESRELLEEKVRVYRRIFDIFKQGLHEQMPKLKRTSWKAIGTMANTSSHENCRALAVGFLEAAGPPQEIADLTPVKFAAISGLSALISSALDHIPRWLPQTIAAYARLINRHAPDRVKVSGPNELHQTDWHLSHTHTPPSTRLLINALYVFNLRRVSLRRIYRISSNFITSRGAKRPSTVSRRRNWPSWKKVVEGRFTLLKESVPQTSASSITRSLKVDSSIAISYQLRVRSSSASSRRKPALRSWYAASDRHLSQYSLKIRDASSLAALPS